MSATDAKLLSMILIDFFCFVYTVWSSWEFGVINKSHCIIFEALQNLVNFNKFSKWPNFIVKFRYCHTSHLSSLPHAEWTIEIDMNFIFIFIHQTNDEIFWELWIDVQEVSSCRSRVKLITIVIWWNYRSSLIRIEWNWSVRSYLLSRRCRKNFWWVIKKNFNIS